MRIIFNEELNDNETAMKRQKVAGSESCNNQMFAERQNNTNMNLMMTLANQKIAAQRLPNQTTVITDRVNTNVI